MQDHIRGQELSQAVKGKITYTDTLAPLPEACAIQIGADSENGAVTDSEGNLVLKNIPIGRRSVRVTYWSSILSFDV